MEAIIAGITETLINLITGDPMNAIQLYIWNNFDSLMTDDDFDQFMDETLYNQCNTIVKVLFFCFFTCYMIRSK